MRILKPPVWVVLAALLFQPSPAAAQWRTDPRAAGAAMGERVPAVPLVEALVAQPTSNLAAGGLVGALLGAGGGFALGGSSLSNGRR